jgi:gluconate 5-dehydrogenase
MTDLSGRVALVTGSANGLGRAIATELALAGARLALVDIDLSGLETAASELANAEAFVCDLASGDETKALPSRVLERLGRVDVLVNNAGVREVAPLQDMRLDSWQRTFAVNVTAPFLLAQGLAPNMLDRGWGRIVNVASVAAELAMSQRVAYNSSKAAVVTLTKSLALELGDGGVTCNAVAPGIVETSLNRDYITVEPLRSVVIANTPAGRWGQPAELAGVVGFLCSDASSFVNGVTIPVDGGWLAAKGY